MKGFGVGGQEVVTSVIADNLLKYGYQISIVFLSKPHGFVFENLNRKIKQHIFDKEEINASRIKAIRKILIDDDINVVINQWGLPFWPAFILKKAVNNLPIKVISVYHNQPNINARIKGVELLKEKKNSPIKKVTLHVMEKIYSFLTRWSMRYVYDCSDKYILLSNAHINDFKNFTRLKDLSKVKVITNPVTIETKDFIYDYHKKKHEIIYVGRIDYNQKRAFRLADIWSLIETKLPDWNFTVVGNGVDYEKFKKYIKFKKVRNINLIGFAPPQEYYKRASIMIMTSEYEGLPLVLAEGMSYGCVPIVFGSFSSIYDIIDDKENGFIIPNNNGFSAKEMANTIIRLANNEKMLIEMSHNAMEKSRKFNVEPIIKQWRELIDEI